MRILFTSMLMLLVSISTSNAQNNNEKYQDLVLLLRQLQLSTDSLRDAYSHMELLGIEMEDKLSLLYQKEISNMESSIKMAFDNSDVITISATYQEVIKSIIHLHNEITQINNFTDAEKVFGIDFAAHIIECAEDNLMDPIEEGSSNEEQSSSINKNKKFRYLIKGVIMNPVISGLLKSNPVSSVVHSIINQFLMMPEKDELGFLEHRKLPLPDNYKHLRGEYNDWQKSSNEYKIIGQRNENRIEKLNRIEQFTKELQPLIHLFEDLSEINHKYESSLLVFMKASEQTIAQVKPLEKGFFTLLEAKNREESRQKIDQFFNLGENPDIELLESRIMDRKMRCVLEYSDEVNDGLSLLKSDFLKIINLEIDLSEEYIAFFTRLLMGRQGIPAFKNQESIELKIAQFEQLHQSLLSQKEKNLQN